MKLEQNLNRFILNMNGGELGFLMHISDNYIDSVESLEDFLAAAYLREVEFCKDLENQFDNLL